MTLAPEDGPRSPLSPLCPPCRARRRRRPHHHCHYHHLRHYHYYSHHPRLLLLVACCWMAAGLTAAAAQAVSTAVASGNSSPRAPWIPDGFLGNYTFNAIARASQCVRRVGPPPAHYCTADGAGPEAGVPHPSCLSDLMERSTPERVCRAPPGEERLRMLRRLRLGFCHRYRVERVLGTARLQQVARANATECRTRLLSLLDMDETAQRVYCEFDQILTRYDCQQRFSIKWTCADCTTAYKAWVCSMLVPFHCGSCLVKPCRHGCHSVEQKCPYFLPDIKQQYAGEPTFLCIDHDIPETEAVTPSSSYGEPPNCYLPCHVGDAVPPCPEEEEEEEEEEENSNASSPSPSPSPTSPPPPTTRTSSTSTTTTTTTTAAAVVDTSGDHRWPHPASPDTSSTDFCFPLRQRHDEPCGPLPTAAPTNVEVDDESWTTPWSSTSSSSSPMPAAPSSSASSGAPYPWRRSFSWQQRGQWWRCGPCLLVVALAAAVTAVGQQMARRTFLPFPFCLGLT